MFIINIHLLQTGGGMGNTWQYCNNFSLVSPHSLTDSGFPFIVVIVVNSSRLFKFSFGTWNLYQLEGARKFFPHHMTHIQIFTQTYIYIYMYVYLYKYVCKIVDVCLGKEKGGGEGVGGNEEERNWIEPRINRKD